MDFFNDTEEELDEDIDEWGDEEDLEDSSYVCEDCDYRWEDITAEEVESGMAVCPMCGSVNVTQL